MVSKGIGIRGYLGEEIVRIWLEKVKYPGCKVISQIMPTGIPKNGGPYLDFAVVKDDKLLAVYEVKTQDYPELSVNKAVNYFWKKQGEAIPCISQNGEEYETMAKTKTFLVLLVAPSKVYFKDKKIEPPSESIIFFDQILKKLDELKINYKDALINGFKEDMNLELDDNWHHLLNHSTKNIQALQDQGKVARL